MIVTLDFAPKESYGMPETKSWDPVPFVPSIQPDVEKKVLGYARKDAEASGDVVLLDSSINLTDKTAIHESYAYYLLNCWANHYGAVIRPEMLWFTALTTLAAHGKEFGEISKQVCQLSRQEEDWY